MPMATDRATRPDRAMRQAGEIAAVEFTVKDKVDALKTGVEDRTGDDSMAGSNRIKTEMLP